MISYLQLWMLFLLHLQQTRWVCFQVDNWVCRQKKKSVVDQNPIYDTWICFPRTAAPPSAPYGYSYGNCKCVISLFLSCRSVDNNLFLCCRIDLCDIYLPIPHKVLKLLKWNLARVFQCQPAILSEVVKVLQGIASVISKEVSTHLEVVLLDVVEEIVHQHWAEQKAWVR